VLIEEAEFKESFRGYDRNQVDDLLEQLAARVSQLETESARSAELVRTAESLARADAEAQIEQRVQAELEQRSGAASGVSEEEAAERLRRTLVLAQRTADAAIDEARHEANQLLDQARQEAEDVTTSAHSEAETVRSDAHAEAERLTLEARGESERLLSDARAEKERLNSEANDEAERMRAESMSKLVEETAALEARRTELIADVARLELHVDKQRLRLRDSLTALQRLLDEPGAFEVPALADADDVAATPDQEGVTAPVSDESIVDHPEPEVVIVDGVASPESAETTEIAGDGSNEQPAEEEDGFLLELRQAMTDEDAPSDVNELSAERSGAGRPQGSGPSGNRGGSQSASGRPPKFGRRR